MVREAAAYAHRVPVVAACLVPAAPALLPELTGGEVPELAAVRAAVSQATAVLRGDAGLGPGGPDLVLVLAAATAASLAGFGAPPPAAAGRGGPELSGVSRQLVGAPGWQYELAARLLTDADPGPERAGAGGRGAGWAGGRGPAWAGAVEWADWGEVDADVGAWVGGVATDPRRTVLLLLADGSRTRGVRAPGGNDPRGLAVDEELLAAVRARRPAVVPDARAVGATAGAAVAVFAALTGGTVRVLHQDAPLGVGYLVLSWRQ